MTAERLVDPAVSARGLLHTFEVAGVLGWADVHPALHLTYLYGESDERVQLALALTVRALRDGSMCVDLASVAGDSFDVAGEAVNAADLPWPEPEAWLTAVAASPCARVGEPADDDPRPLRLVDGLLYLERSWADQETVRVRLLELLALPSRTAPDVPDADVMLDPDQVRAVETALSSPVSVLAGGPGTGKTTIIRQVLHGARAADPDVLVAFAAPTGKAAARMAASLGAAEASASTIHRLLGWRPGSRTRFAHDAHAPLPHDLVVIDEVSMVSMTLMARLLAALRPDARLVLVGDPDQLASVEAGAVLADIVASPAFADAVATLRTNHRSAGAVAALADAIRDGDADAALAILASDDPAVSLLDGAPGERAIRARTVSAGVRMHAAASAGDAGAALAALDEHRLLCAHRAGPYGVTQWAARARAWLAHVIGAPAEDVEYPVGRPLMMTRNAADLELYNGDTGVVIATPDGGTTAVFAVGHETRRFSPWVLDGLVSVEAMTIHKSQGSQFADVSIVLPPPESPLLTRELLYTAVTRAEASVLLLGSADAVRAAIARPARRTSGLASRLVKPAATRPPPTDSAPPTALPDGSPAARTGGARPVDGSAPTG